jgi:hypothetical protein
VLFGFYEIYILKFALVFLWIFVRHFTERIGPVVSIMYVFVVWACSIGTSPFTTSDYILYQDVIYDYADFPNLFFGDLAAVGGLIKFDGFGYYYLYLLKSIFLVNCIFQVACSFLIISSVVFYCKTLGLRPIAIVDTVLLTCVSSFMLFSSDWYLRQGFGISLFVIALLTFRLNIDRRLQFLLFSSLALFSISWHVSCLYLFIIYGFCNIILRNKGFLRFLQPLYLKRSTYIFTVLFVSALIILPLRILDVKLSFGDFFDYLLHYKSIYEESEWPPVRPGIGFIVHFVLWSIAAALLFGARNSEHRNYAFRMNLLAILLFVTVSALIAMNISSLGSRFLLPFSFFWILTTAGVTRFGTYRLSLSSLNSLLILFYSGYMVFENGGIARDS